MEVKKILLLVLLIAIAQCADTKRRFVFEMFRHGARSPWGSPMGDDRRDLLGQAWKIGDSELTPIGMRQHYLLGSFSRQDFDKDNYLSQDYSPDEIYVAATDFNRTIMSAQSHLQGLYPYSKTLKLNDAQIKRAVPPIEYSFDKEKEALKDTPLLNNMQVVPIHVMDKGGREYYLHDGDVCPASTQFKEPSIKSAPIASLHKKILEKYGDKLAKLPSLNGYNLTDYHTMYSIMDAYMSDYTEQLPMENFQEVGIDKDEFYADCYQWMINDMFEYSFGTSVDKDAFIARMSMSPTFRRIIGWMDERITRDGQNKGYENYKAPKLVMYSGHDTNLAAMQGYMKAAFKFTDYIYVPYASKMRITLLQTQSADASHKYLADDYQITVEINGKPLIGQISYNEFKKKITDVSVSQEEIYRFCGFNVVATQSFSYYGFMIATICLSILTIGLIVYMIISNRKRRNFETNQPEYARV